MFITVRIPDQSLHELDDCAQSISLSRTDYVRLAIEQMNKKILNKQTAEHLKKASLRVRKESMRINKEFGG